ncbi:hypothetical protein F4805DRAFT_462136 [Annulohypoxylon moriforme]|nr:hypothetical protein F4805DRAFT_462136 [Annulohypoxylon moriforme]
MSCVCVTNSHAFPFVSSPVFVWSANHPKTPSEKPVANEPNHTPSSRTVYPLSLSLSLSPTNAFRIDSYVLKDHSTSGFANLRREARSRVRHTLYLLVWLVLACAHATHAASALQGSSLAPGPKSGLP